MRFRRLYWVTEQIDEHGHSAVTGVYTSIPDLYSVGLRWLGPEADYVLRLSLVQLDSSGGPLGCWTSPSFEGLADGLRPFIESQEFGRDETNQLMAELAQFSKK